MLAKLAHHAESRRTGRTARVVAISALAAIAAVFATQADAASFNCQRKAATYSASERIVCNDPELSSLDEKLAAAYSAALTEAADKQALTTSRDQQWKWRQANCKDRACVQSWYERRIAELNADYKHAKQEQQAAFEASLTEQQLAPSAADAVRNMKQEQANAPQVQADVPAKTAVK